MTVPKKFFYTSTHEWVRVENDEIVVGITDFAQEQLSDIRYVELPGVNDVVSAQDDVAVLESVKAAADVCAPVDGVITDVNRKLSDRPDLVNSEPYDAGWIFRMRPDDIGDVDTLLDAESYEELLPEDET